MQLFSSGSVTDRHYSDLGLMRISFVAHNGVPRSLGHIYKKEKYGVYVGDLRTNTFSCCSVVASNSLCCDVYVCVAGQLLTC